MTKKKDETPEEEESDDTLAPRGLVADLSDEENDAKETDAASDETG